MTIFLLQMRNKIATQSSNKPNLNRVLPFGLAEKTDLGLSLFTTLCANVYAPALKSSSSCAGNQKVCEIERKAALVKLSIVLERSILTTMMITSIIFMAIMIINTLQVVFPQKS